MANEIIRPSALPVRTNPVPSEVVPSDNQVSVAGVSWEDGVNSAVPPASQAEAEAGVINSKRMTPLTTKQAIDAQVPSKISTAINSLNLGTMSQEIATDYTPTSGLAAVALSNEYGDLDNLPTLGTAAATDAADYATAAQGAKADTAVQSIVAGLNVSVDNTDPLNPVVSSTGGGVASSILYNNEESGLSADDVQDAIDELASSRRELMTAARVFYVRTDGNDNNDGSANTPEGAFLTLQGAWDYISEKIDIGGQTCTIKLADGTYTAGMRDLDKPAVGGRVDIEGNTTTPANVVVAATSGDCIESSDSFILVSGMTLRNTNGSALHAYRNGVIQVGASMVFGACSEFHFFSDNQGQILSYADYAVNGGALAHWYAHTEGLITVVGRTVTLTGTPNFTSFFAEAVYGGNIEAATTTYSGSATGRKFSVVAAGIISVNTDDVTILPGSTPGRIVNGTYGFIPYARFTTSTTEVQTDVPVGSIITAYVAGTAPAMNAAVTLYVNAGANYASMSSGSLLTGSWRCRGRSGNDGSGTFFIAQRVD